MIGFKVTRENHRFIAHVQWTIRFVVTLALLATIRWVAVGSDDVVRRDRLETIGPCRLVTMPSL